MNLLRLKRKHRAIVGIVFLALVLLLFLGGGGYLGLFSSVTLTRETAGPFRVIGVDRYGSLRKATLLRQEEVMPYLRDQELLGVIGKPVALVDNAFAKVPRDQRHSIVGYLVDSDAEIEVEPPLQLIDLPGQESLIATLNAHRSVAAFKAYRAIKERWQPELANGEFVPAASTLEIEEGEGEMRIVVPLQAE